MDKLKYILTEISRENIEKALSKSDVYNRINLNPEELVKTLNKETFVKASVGEVEEEVVVVDEEVSELELLTTKIGLNTINYTNIETISETISENEEEEDEEIKYLSRKYHHLFTGARISFTYYLNNVLIGHNTPADLSLLKDFETFKPELDLVNKSFITLGKGFRYGKYNVVIRDTMLLAPAPQKKLANIGKLYHFEKIELSEFEITNMDILLKTNPNKYKEYAMKDSLITLKHALWMEGFYFNINGLGIQQPFPHR